MHTLVFATNNQHKTDEIKFVIGDLFDVVSLKEAGINEEIPEPFDTLEENASIKSQTIYKLTGKDCFSEDTGLEVYALDGQPGVKSARYAGDHRDFNENIYKLLHNLEGFIDRGARFRTVISLILNGKEHHFEGICEGSIGLEMKGENGFGYDPVFIPEGQNRTFAEMSREEKTRYSHRTKATAKLLAFLSINGK